MSDVIQKFQIRRMFFSGCIEMFYMPCHKAVDRVRNTGVEGKNPVLLCIENMGICNFPMYVGNRRLYMPMINTGNMPSMLVCMCVSNMRLLLSAKGRE